VRKTVAAGSAVTLGIIGAASPLMALPAVAADALPCTTFLESAVGEGQDNWYANCVPQFGLGKVEFTISSDIDFPADFKDLNDPSVEISTTANLDALNSYFGSSPGEEITSPLIGFVRTDDDSNPKVQKYFAGNFGDGQVAAFKIASVAKVASSELPSSCSDFGSSYPDVYSVTFEPLDVTFTQTINGEDWTYHIVMTPQTGFIGGTVGSASFDGGEPLCLAQGTYFSGGATASDEGWEYSLYAATSVNPYPSNESTVLVADYPRSVAELPQTGSSVTAGIGFAGMLVLLGVALSVIRRRRA
jgi:LPXTG-motif cell wall-anchored protein